MKKKKIFYFLKTKEEYDYMLNNGLIPKRGIVLVESTQEIYRNKVPYSGYGPLKTYFDKIKSDLLSLLLDKTEDLSSLVELIDLKLQKDINDYNTNFLEKLNNLLVLITQDKSKLSELSYYVNNTLAQTVKDNKDNIEDLSNKYTTLLLQVASNISLVETFQTNLSELINNLLEFKSKYSSEISSIQNSIIDLSLKIGNGSNSVDEAKVSEIIRSMLLTTEEFNLKVKTYMDPVLSSWKLDILNSLKPGDDIDLTTYASLISYVDNKFNIHASTLNYGTIKVGQYLTTDENGILSIKLNDLKTALELTPSNPGENNSSLAQRVRVLEAIISQKNIERTINDILLLKDLTPVIDYTSEQFRTGMWYILYLLGIIDYDENGNAVYKSEISGFDDIDLTTELDGTTILSVSNNINQSYKVSLSNHNGLLVLKFDSNHILTEGILIGGIMSGLNQTEFGIGLIQYTVNGSRMFSVTDKGFSGLLYNLKFKYGICIGVDDNSVGYTGTKNGFTFKNGICVGYKETTSDPLVYTVTPPNISGTTPFENSTLVTITNTNSNYQLPSGVTLEIWYTLGVGNVPDDPTKLNGTLYTGPFTITESTTVKAVTFIGDSLSSVSHKTFMKSNGNTEIELDENPIDDPLRDNIVEYLGSPIIMGARTFSLLTTASIYPNVMFADVPEELLSTDLLSLPIYYTTDGSIPTQDSQLYSVPLIILQTTTIRARNITTINNNIIASEISNAIFTKN